jgi:hypothetical protein
MAHEDQLRSHRPTRRGPGGRPDSRLRGLFTDLDAFADSELGGSAAPFIRPAELRAGVDRRSAVLLKEAEEISSSAEAGHKARIAMQVSDGQYFVGCGTLALINGGLAQGKHRSGLNWFLLSIFLGPLATLILLFVD